MVRNIAIINYNTPELVEAAILSVRKHGGESWPVYVMDNSDCRPFTKKMAGVTRIDNTNGQVVDFDAELAKFPDKDYKMGCIHGGNFGSARHIMSVQALWDLIPDGFMLLDSDILIKDDVEFMFREDLCTVGHIQSWLQAGNRGQVDRLVPMVLWINVPLCKAGGARFFDPARAWALHGGGSNNRMNWYDTGASFLEDIKTKKPACHGMAIDIRPLMEHYQGASWIKPGRDGQLEWLNQHRDLWAPSDDYVLGDPDWKRPANRGVKIYISAHGPFRQIVDNSVYEVLDSRIGGDVCNGVCGSFYSEALQLHRLSERSKLPQVVGSCGYRKYFFWQNDVPSLLPLLRKHRCLVSQNVELDQSMRSHYQNIVGNVEDLDIATEAVAALYPDFLPAWQKALASHVLHPASMFVMYSGSFREMMAMVWSVIEKYLSVTGTDIDARIREHAQAYHLGFSTVSYQRRIGGQLCERLISAWIDWKWPEAKEIPIVVYPKS